MFSGKQNYSWVSEIFVRGFLLQGFKVAFFFPRSQFKTAVHYLSQIDSLFSFSLQDPDNLDQADKQQLKTFMDG